MIDYIILGIILLSVIFVLRFLWQRKRETQNCCASCTRGIHHDYAEKKEDDT